MVKPKAKKSKSSLTIDSLHASTRTFTYDPTGMPQELPQKVSLWELWRVVGRDCQSQRTDVLMAQGTL